MDQWLLGIALVYIAIEIWNVRRVLQHIDSILTEVHIDELVAKRRAKEG